MRIGELDVTPALDGTAWVPPTLLFNKTESDWQRHQAFLNDDGMLPIALGSFVIRSQGRTILVDAGIGPSDQPDAGLLLANLAAQGVQPSDVTDVVLTHLHFDHVGWTSDGEHPTFPKATYRCDERDWQFF